MTIGLFYMTEKGRLEKYDVHIKNEKLLFESGDKCFLAIFADQTLKQDTWYLGSHAMQDYYLVFDVTPLHEHKKDFIQIGIAPASKTQPMRQDEYHQIIAPPNSDLDGSKSKWAAGNSVIN